MATMNVSLPEPMKSWAERQAETGRYSNTSDYIRDLIRKDQEKAEKIGKIQELVTQGLASGEGSHGMEPTSSLQGRIYSVSRKGVCTPGDQD